MHSSHGCCSYLFNSFLEVEVIHWCLIIYHLYTLLYAILRNYSHYSKWTFCSKYFSSEYNSSKFKLFSTDRAIPVWPVAFQLPLVAAFNGHLQRGRRKLESGTLSWWHRRGWRIYRSPLQHGKDLDIKRPSFAMETFNWRYCSRAVPQLSMIS